MVALLQPRPAALHTPSLGRRSVGLTVFYVLFGLNLAAVALAHFALVSPILPFYTAIVLYFFLIAADRTIFVVYPGLILMTLWFLAPLIFSNLPIAVKGFHGDSNYDRGLVFSLYWFVALFPVYFPAAQSCPHRTARDLDMVRLDAIAVGVSLILLLFSALMLQNGTLITGNYRDVTAQRLGFIEYAAMFSLLGLCTVRSAFVRNLLIACIGIYLVSCVLVGLRLRFLSCAIVLFCCLFGMKLDQRWKITGLLVAGFLFMLGQARNTGFANLDLTQLFSSDQFYRGRALVSTPGGAFQTSKFYAFYVDRIAPYHGGSGLSFLLGDIVSIFTTKGALPQSMGIKRVTTSIFDTPGGGLAPGFFFAYFGVTGAIVLSGIFMFVFNFIVRMTSRSMFPYQTLLVAYAPRTLLYDWTVVFKMMFTFFVFSSLIRLASSK